MQLPVQKHERDCSRLLAVLLEERWGPLTLQTVVSGYSV
jgi:hypothetical protein